MLWIRPAAVAMIPPDQQEGPSFRHEYIKNKERALVDQQPISVFQKLKLVGKQYGLTFVVTYWSLWAVTFSSTYYMFKYNMVSPESLYLDVAHDYYVKGLHWVLETTHIDDVWNRFLGQSGQHVFGEMEEVQSLTKEEELALQTTSAASSKRSEDLFSAFILSKVTKPLQFLLALSITPTVARFMGLAPKPVANSENTSGTSDGSN
jgi:hypothetical protein